MSLDSRNKAVKPCKNLFLIQLVIVIIFAILVLGLYGVNSAQSIVLGSLVQIIPNMCCARNMFKYQGATSAKKIVSGFYKGEAVKIILSIILFALVFNYIRIDPILFFGAYISMQLLLWLLPLII